MHANQNLWTNLALSLHRVRVDVAGAESLPGDGRYLLVSNHRSAVDAALIRSGLGEPGLWFPRPAEGPALPVGSPLMAWPEGRINTAEELLPFSPRPFELARREGLPIAIASLRGSERAVRWMLRPARVCLRILGVIPPGEYGDLDGEKLAQIARERITDDLLREDPC